MGNDKRSDDDDGGGRHGPHSLYPSGPQPSQWTWKVGCISLFLSLLSTSVDDWSIAISLLYRLCVRPPPRPLNTSFIISQCSPTDGRAWRVELNWIESGVAGRNFPHFLFVSAVLTDDLWLNLWLEFAFSHLFYTGQLLLLLSGGEECDALWWISFTLTTPRSIDSQLWFLCWGWDSLQQQQQHNEKHAPHLAVNWCCNPHFSGYLLQCVQWKMRAHKKCVLFWPLTGLVRLHYTSTSSTVTHFLPACRLYTLYRYFSLQLNAFTVCSSFFLPSTTNRKGFGLGHKV